MLFYIKSKYLQNNIIKKDNPTKKWNYLLSCLSGRQDSNLRPLGPKPSALPSWATSRTTEFLSFFTKEMHPRGLEPLTPWFVVKYSIQLSYGCKWCRGPESNRHGDHSPQDFKSCASTCSATPALEQLVILTNELTSWTSKRKTGFEPATPTLARWCSTTELLSQKNAG